MSADQAIRAFLEKQIDRREFIDRLRMIGVTAGAAFTYADVLAGYQLLGATDAVAAAADAPVALAPSEFKLVEAISARILPSTDTAGAVEAGSVYYIDRALGDAYKSQLPRYRAGLAGLDRHCTAHLGKAFAALEPEQQDEVLETLEAGKIVEVEGGTEFFDLIRRHVMEGFFCEPYYGGNRDMVGWKLVGFPGQQHGYLDPYINKRINLPPVADGRMTAKGGNHG
jgi:gluconate 2-dehydrogenase gamma chain